MKKKRWRVPRTILGIVLSLFVAYWVLDLVRWTIKGQVVDADTGKPIQGAVVAIDWWEAAFGPPGLSTSKDMEVSEDTSDAQGNFHVPKYATFGLGREFNMVVYKHGYVLWSSWKIFPSYAERKDFSLRSGMKIKLQPFKEEYSKEAHAMFVSHMQPLIGARKFTSAVKSENELAAELVRKNWGK
ncbi:MAG TPA: TonB-dependent receptor [Syntrophobacteraceae bacterium]|jgi:hypothetical protein|nr:TonB-dependent receptor [Syntrophobacteraceae bacterium]HBD10325.1 TonB-dependent receptor [Syntrophobacteraceae bacterium]HBZ57268.1 TonB-dependent receptor [Syntrophobacteraceae bacterium]